MNLISQIAQLFQTAEVEVATLIETGDFVQYTNHKGDVFMGVIIEVDAELQMGWVSYFVADADYVGWMRTWATIDAVALICKANEVDEWLTS